MSEIWDRLESLIGKESLSLLKTKSILVIGLGGVGGYVVEGLVRSGVGNLTVVDSDIVDATNLNRQIIALSSTIGKEKAALIKMRALDINKNLNIDSKQVFLDEEHLAEVFDKEYDYVIDACDTIKTKKLLIHKCLTEHIPIISCLGTARKLDPKSLEISDIKKTSYDPLAKILRKYMKEEFPNRRLMVLSSKEVPQKTEDGVLASCIFVPATAGLLIAHFVVSELIK